MVQRLLLLVWFLWTVTLTVYPVYFLLWLQSQFGHTSCLFSGFPYSKCLFCHLPLMGEIRVLFYSSSHKGLTSTMFRCLQGGNPFLHRIQTKHENSAVQNAKALACPITFLSVVSKAATKAIFSVFAVACCTRLYFVHWCLGSDSNTSTWKGWNVIITLVRSPLFPWHLSLVMLDIKDT